MHSMPKGKAKLCLGGKKQGRKRKNAVVKPVFFKVFLDVKSYRNLSF